MVCAHLDPNTFLCAFSQKRCVDTPKEQCKPKWETEKKNGAKAKAGKEA